MLIGNKLDLRQKRSVCADDGYKLAKKLDVLFEETSAYKDTKVQKAILRLIDHAMNRIQHAEIGIEPRLFSSPESPCNKQSAGEKDNNLFVVCWQPSRPKSKLCEKVQHCAESKIDSCLQFSCFY